MRIESGEIYDSRTVLEQLEYGRNIKGVEKSGHGSKGVCSIIARRGDECCDWGIVAAIGGGKVSGRCGWQ
jgi:hypothetical protein